MIIPLAKAEDWIFPFVMLGVCFLLLIIGIFVKAREFLYPRTVYGRLRRFFGARAFTSLQTHEKSYPGYDLASVNLALTNLLAECCSTTIQVGAFGMSRNLRFALDSFSQPFQRKVKSSPPSYERLPVDMERDESFISSCLWLCKFKSANPGEPDEQLALMLASSTAMVDYEEDMDARTTPATNVNVSVACRDRAVADRFFNELESRRKRMSIYRGKVIDPVVGPGGIRTIGFKKIHPVSERDLILTDQVKQVIHNSIVGFYNHQETLRRVGVEMKRGILFHSPPGTGKTSISLYLANLLPNFTVCFVSGRRLLYPRELCSMARYLQPTMLVFEDIDLIAAERDMNGLATVLGELMNQIDGCEPNDQVLFIMNTNSMDRIETAVRNRPGRVDQIIHLALPDQHARLELLRHFARNLTCDPGELEKAAAGTDGATPATLKEVVKRAAVNSLDRDGAAPPTAGIRITAQDLLLAYEQIQFMRPDKAAGAIL